MDEEEREPPAYRPSSITGKPGLIGPRVVSTRRRQGGEGEANVEEE